MTTMTRAQAIKLHWRSGGRSLIIASAVAIASVWSVVIIVLTH